MAQYIVRRVLISIPVLFGILVLVFVIARLLPGDPCHILLGERANAAVCADFSHRYGFDQPIATQFATYLSNFFHGDLGSSLLTNEPVTTHAQQQALGRELPVAGVPMILSGWAYSLAELQPWSHQSPSGVRATPPRVAGCLPR